MILRSLEAGTGKQKLDTLLPLIWCKQINCSNDIIILKLYILCLYPVNQGDCIVWYREGCGLIKTI